MNLLDWTKKVLHGRDLGQKSQDKNSGTAKNPRLEKSQSLALFLEPGTLNVKVVRKRGVKNLTLRFQSQNDITVTVPWQISKSSLIKFLESKKDWLEEQQKTFSKWTPWLERKGLPGETYFYLGQEFELRYGLTLLNQILIQPDPHHPGRAVLWCHWPEKFTNQEPSPEPAEKALKKFFSLEAERLLKPRVLALAEKIQIPAPTKINFRSQKSRWGSCSTRKVINLNRKLVGAPLNVIDSVILHELCHLKHMNHSPEFWKLLSTHCPDHAQADEWLNNHQLMLF